MNKYLLFFLTTFILSCQTPEKKEISYVKEHFPTNNTKQLYLFIPSDACSMCIKNVESHLNLIEKPHINIIFTGKTKREIKPLTKNLSSFYNVTYETQNPYLLGLTELRIIIYKPERGYTVHTFDGSNDYAIIDTIDAF